MKYINKNNFLKLLFRLRFYKLHKKGVYVYPFSSIGKFTIIGKGTIINGKCYINSHENAKVIIGKYCAIAHNLRIRSRNHDIRFPNIQDKFQNQYKFVDLSVFKGDVQIGNGCWIGDNVMILAGVTIGNGAVIGGGSIVTKDVPDFGVAVGNPAKIIKYRFDEKIISELKQIEWWNWDTKKIENNKIFFNTDLTAYDSSILELVI